METTAQHTDSTSGKTADIFAVDVGPDGVAVVTFDVPGEPVNAIGVKVGEQMRLLMPRLLDDGRVRSVVLISGKKDNFIAGADISMLQSIRSAAEATQLSREMQSMLDRLAASRKPVVAAIHGACLGGGLELAMACQYRVASEDRKTKLGVPEVMLGLIPGGGGTQRLPQLAGVQAALDLILTGRELTAKKAQKAGVVDEVVPQAILLQVARTRAREFADGKPLPLRGSAALMARFKKGQADQKMLTALALEQNFLGRKVLFQQAEKMAAKKSRGNYPAIPAALAAVRAGLEGGMEAGLKKEAELFGQLVITDVSKKLISIFFGQTALKKDSGVDDPSVIPAKVEHVGVLGGGLMGGGIAYVSAALAKTQVRLKDKDAAGVGRGLQQVCSVVDPRVKRRSLSPQDRTQILARVTGTTDYTGFANTDVVIEAVFEDLELKHRIIRDVEAVVKPSCIFASNTSTLPITKLAQASARPQNVVGMHYFSPVHKMPLLEIIRGGQTSDAVVATCVALGKAQGKTVIVVNDGPGFYTSRILAPYINEAAHILSEGGDIRQVDEAMVDWGFPVGPFQLLDEVGIDVATKAAKTMVEAFGERMMPPDGMQKGVEQGRLGRKSGKGFYLYGAAAKQGHKEVDLSVYELTSQGRNRKSFPVDEIQERLALQFCNEAALCLQEKILRNPRDGDIGAVFGLGFPPFRGGPFQYMDSVGAADMVRRLRGMEQRFGVRFAPAAILLEMAENGTRFHKS